MTFLDEYGRREHARDVARQRHERATYRYRVKYEQTEALRSNLRAGGREEFFQLIAADDLAELRRLEEEEARCWHAYERARGRFEEAETEMQNLQSGWGL